MTLITRICLGLAVLLVGGLAWTVPAWAKDFKADYTVDYTLAPDSGLMHVSQHVTLTNQVANLRASSYSLTLENNSYKNLTARDSDGQMQFSESKNDQGSPVITFTFNDKVVGVGKTLKWTIEYDSPTLAQHHGQTWDITIPRVKEHPSYDIGAYDVQLSIPKSVGPPAFISPSGTADTTDTNAYLYHFNRDQVLPTGIVATFGQAQIFRFTLKYHLHNPNLGQASTEIALPPDVPGYQQIIYDKLSPQPVSLHTDDDGNALATYYLSSHADMDVTFTGWAKTIANHPDLANKGLAKDLPTNLVATYTKEQSFWQVSDPDIVKKTLAITDPQKPVVVNAKAIYDYVTTTLQYNTARINKDLKRLGASEAFKNPKNAVCMEFTDVFITMARIAGIPAREVDGYAYTSDSANHPIFYPGLGSDILHAWAEIYLPGSGWVMVDPTWGSTTGGVDFFGRIDLNRIAFALKGVSSTTPYAAGSYKTDAKQDGDVQVAFADKSVEPVLGLEVHLTDRQVIAGIGSTVPLTIKNKGNAALYGMSVKPDLPKILQLSRQADIPTILLPGQTTTAWLPLRTASWLTSTDTSLPVTVSAHDIANTQAKDSQRYPLSIQPFFAAIVIPVLILVAIVAMALGGGWLGLHKLYHKTAPKSLPQ
jgi:transglutaminase-like putative cysteine protease